MSDFHYDTNICYIDIITCNSDLLLKLLESVISKLFFKSFGEVIFFSFFNLLKKDKSYKMYLLAKQDQTLLWTCVAGANGQCVNSLYAKSK